MSTPPTPDLDVRWLGRISFAEGLRIQEEIVGARIGNRCTDTLLLLEHDPVFTIGRTRDTSSLRNPEALPFPVEQTNRGGQATYHGPGQLVGYFLMDLGARTKDLHRFLRWIEEGLIELAGEAGMDASRREGLTGVWVEDRKLASIGVGVRHWVTMHGFALNVCGGLDGFNHIVPCGISGVTMTSLERETGRTWTVRESADRAGKTFLKAARAL